MQFVPRFVRVPCHAGKASQNAPGIDLKREVRDIKGAAPVRATLIFYVFEDFPEKTH